MRSVKDFRRKEAWEGARFLLTSSPAAFQEVNPCLSAAKRHVIPVRERIFADVG